tara:strand:+ start:70 stop:774 length:705 start_codon:yes stop_codon:yes gene_type:complete
MELLIDGDVIVYRIGFATQHKDEDGEVVADPLAYALHSCKVYINGMVKKTGAEKSRLFLTGKGNFRNTVDSEYKANRKDTAKPIHYQAIRDYMVKSLGAEMIEGMEADDKLALCQTDDTMIATIDKDLLMVAGKHYNFVKDEYITVTQDEGTHWFYMQMLMGDKVDNIIGIKGIGKVKAAKILAESEDWDCTVEDKYQEFFTEENWWQRLVQNTQLLWMLQTDVKMPMEIRGDI